MLFLMVVTILPIIAKSEDVLSMGLFLPNDFFFQFGGNCAQILFSFIDTRVFSPPF